MNSFEDYSLIEQMVSMLNSEETSLKDGNSSAAVQIKDFIDKLPGGFLIYNADGAEDIIYANQALIKMFRCDNMNEFRKHTGNSFRGIVYREDLDAVEKSIKEQIAASHDDLDYVEYRIKGKDGIIRWVEDYGHYVRTHTMGNIFYVFISDATEKITKRNKELLKQKALLETALNVSKQAYIAKNSFLSNMSHDLRTPLNALFGYIELAKKNVTDVQTVEKYLDKMNYAGKQLLDLVDKVLEVSYMESKEFQINEALCNLNDVTKEVYDEVLPSAADKQIDVALEYRDVVHSEVYTDKDKLRQILSHIASNAVKYTGNGGKIRLTMEERYSASSEFATFRFVMTDTGIGIAKDSLEKIFEPFEREYNSTQSGIFGSGLGLTIAKHIIETMGGTITAESEVGKGSAFTVTLSFRLSEKAETASDDEKVLNHLKGKKILLVEDNEINLEVETDILEDLGLIIDPAENGRIAVDKIKNSAPNEYLFVLMDIQMPVMDGRQATEEIRKLKDPALAGIPIFALSANALESDKQLSVKTGMDAHLTKPIDIPLLIKTVAKTLKL